MDGSILYTASCNAVVSYPETIEAEYLPLYIAVRKAYNSTGNGISIFVTIQDGSYGAVQKSADTFETLENNG